MTYRDLIDIPDIPFVPFEERFREPIRASAPRWEGSNPVHVTPKGGPRPNAGHQPKAPRPIADLTHRIAGCEGNLGQDQNQQVRAPDCILLAVQEQRGLRRGRRHEHRLDRR